jgi:hypothetical protein
LTSVNQCLCRCLCNFAVVHRAGSFATNVAHEVRIVYGRSGPWIGVRDETSIRCARLRGDTSASPSAVHFGTDHDRRGERRDPVRTPTGTGETTDAVSASSEIGDGLYSIAVGIGAGFMAYVLIKLVRGKAAEVHPLLWAVAVLFLVYFAIDPIEQLLT